MYVVFFLYSYRILNIYCYITPCIYLDIHLWLCRLPLQGCRDGIDCIAIDVVIFHNAIIICIIADSNGICPYCRCVGSIWCVIQRERKIQISFGCDSISGK